MEFEEQPSKQGIVTQLDRGNCVVGSNPIYPKRLLMECAKTLISTMLSKIVMQTTKTGTDKCKAGLYATLIIQINAHFKEIFREYYNRRFRLYMRW